MLELRGVVKLFSLTPAVNRVSFTARAGAVRLFDGRTGAPTADVAFV